MESTIARLHSFSRWTDAVSPSRLSNLGFYYSGHGDVVVCYLCLVEIESRNKTVAEIIEQHRVRSPSCSAAATTVEDKPLKDNTTRKAQTNCLPENGPTHHQSYSPLSAVHHRDVVDRSSPDFDRLRSEKVRLETFHDWPPRAARVVDPRDLAKAGLFYTGQGDRVQCAFCRGFLHSWVIGDRPIDEHRKHFPDCSFLRELERGRVDNVIMEFTSSSLRVQSSETNHRLTPSLGTFSVLDSVSATNPSNRLPRHPEFGDIAKRVRSFGGKTVGNGHTAGDLAEAGFFYVGPHDNVRCFHCDGGLKNWRPTDDPWTEHARWFPRCPFLLANKDHRFIRDAQTNTDDRASLTYTFNCSAATNAKYRVEPREIKARMDSPSVQAIIKMGFNRDTIRRVIEDRLTTTGDDFPNLQSMLAAVMDCKEHPEPRNTPAPSDRNTIQNSVDTVSAASSVLAGDREIHEEHSASSAGAINAHPLNTAMLNILDENRELKEARTCKVCMDEEVDTVFLPCGHLVCCNNCSPELRNCPICRALIRGTVKIFLS